MASRKRHYLAHKGIESRIFAARPPSFARHCSATIAQPPSLLGHRRSATIVVAPPSERGETEIVARAISCRKNRRSGCRRRRKKMGWRCRWCATAAGAVLVLLLVRCRCCCWCRAGAATGVGLRGRRRHEDEPSLSLNLGIRVLKLGERCQMASFWCLDADSTLRRATLA